LDEHNVIPNKLWDVSLFYIFEIIIPFIVNFKRKNILIQLSDNIWEHIREGDEKAFRIIFERFYSELCGYASHILHNNQISEELVQDIFIKIWNNRHKIEIKNSPRAYLYQSVHNQAINHAKQLMTEKFRRFQLMDESRWKFIENNYFIDDYLIEKLEAKDTQIKIEHAIAELPPQCKEVFKLNRFEEKSVTEIAHQLNVSENTVRTQLFRALSKIKKAILFFL
jgi:RNA polymerase sigma-70 factor, ECF subfamily